MKQIVFEPLTLGVSLGLWFGGFTEVTPIINHSFAKLMIPASQQ